MFYSTVINSSEREAAYVIDGLMHNNVVQSDIHSTDTHGFSEVIYASTYLLGFRFAPRIKNLKKQKLYSFSSIKFHEKEGHLIRPKELLKEDLIEEYWDQILRFIVTIKLKKANASDLFRRLNSYSDHSPFYKALKEFGRIIKSLGILDYLDNHELRQRVEKQLNKVESVQKFSRGILVSGKYDFSSGIREEQLLIEGAKRLVQNSVLAWNYLYVSKRIATAKSYYEKSRIVSLAQSGSPIFWKHLNFYGNYDYGSESLRCKFNFDFRALKALKV
jgi:TnpA family transposase